VAGKTGPAAWQVKYRLSDNISFHEFFSLVERKRLKKIVIDHRLGSDLEETALRYIPIWTLIK